MLMEQILNLNDGEDRNKSDYELLKDGMEIIKNILLPSSKDGLDMKALYHRHRTTTTKTNAITSSTTARLNINNSSLMSPKSRHRSIEVIRMNAGRIRNTLIFMLPHLSASLIHAFSSNNLIFRSFFNVNDNITVTTATTAAAATDNDMAQGILVL